MNREPFVKLKPAFKDYLWGGNRLKNEYGKESDLSIVAESWELSAHGDGQSIVDSGNDKGNCFGEYIAKLSIDELGTEYDINRKFPMLVKFIDAKDNLSVQVHPDNEYALRVEGEYGKNEMWYVAACDEGSFLYVGFNRDVTREEVAKRLSDNTILEILNRVETHPGDHFYIPAGTVHAIGKGNLICEIQQSSNSTYRLYDYNRRDKDGNLRQLHIDKALDVLNYKKYVNSESKNEGNGYELLCSCEYFKAEKFRVDDFLSLSVDTSHFASVICLDGEGYIESEGYKETVKKGDSIFVLAGKCIAFTGNMDLVISTC